MSPRAVRGIALASAMLALSTCAAPTFTVSPAPSTSDSARQTPTPTTVAVLTFAPSGITRCGIIPDWTCTHFIQVTGRDGVVHEGFFDDPLFGTPPPSYEVVGDVPPRLASGHYRVTFLKQRVSDIFSSEPVPGGTPRLTNRGDVFATCETEFEVVGPANVRIDIAFEESTCVANATVTPSS